MARFCSQVSFVIGMLFFYLTVARFGDKEFSERLFLIGLNFMFASAGFYVLERRE